ncbi:MBL fold metallo-hydrolase [Parabacteroides sp. PF5-9]|uniref:MBL fold metallo-hydrolase n=1 Tax=Parabacteroides sp. PF5-9 TaxID=1742404 RepID=UPI0024767C6C|nr:MBL fold metallo-hydrolase [Parabacteroides sp. PF5-9]MDH6358076.1 hydroxyacylglutathione hydrolase [Parabacteroides sp. PF5-9]
MITVQTFEVNFFMENTYLLYDETREAVLIDCGCVTPEEEKRLSDFVAQEKLTIKRYLCTHLHLDHILGNEYVYRTYGLSPEAHKTETEGLPSPEQQAQLFGLPITLKNVPVTNYLVGGDTIKFGHSELTTLLVPGHSPGSLVFYNKENGYLFTGDALFAGSIGRTDLWGGNQEVLITAIQEKLLSLPDETIIYPGHGPTSTIFNEKMNNPFL